MADRTTLGPRSVSANFHGAGYPGSPCIPRIACSIMAYSYGLAPAFHRIPPLVPLFASIGDRTNSLTRAIKLLDLLTLAQQDSPHGIVPSVQMLAYYGSMIWGQTMYECSIKEYRLQGQGIKPKTISIGANCLDYYLLVKSKMPWYAGYSCIYYGRE